MNYLKEALIRNVKKYYVEDVIDFDKVPVKWDFLKMDSMSWDNFVEAKSMGLIKEKDRRVFIDHYSSINKSIHGAAKIFSISLNQCYRRKKVLESLEKNDKKYQSVLNDIDYTVAKYKEELDEVNKYVENIEDLKYDYDNTIFLTFKEKTNQLDQNKQEEIKIWIQSFSSIVSSLDSIKKRLTIFHQQLVDAIQHMKENLDLEIDVMQRASEKMHGMRKQYLYSFAYYARLNKKNESTNPGESASFSENISINENIHGQDKDVSSAGSTNISDKEEELVEL